MASPDSGLGRPAIRSAADGRSGDDGQSHRGGQQHLDEQEPAGALPGPPRPAFSPELVGTDKGPQSADEQDDRRTQRGQRALHGVRTPPLASGGAPTATGQPGTQRRAQPPFGRLGPFFA
jgi:hypothetical protein